MEKFLPAKPRTEVPIGESLRIIRELQGYSQDQLSKLTGIPQMTISLIENGKANLDVEQAKILAHALKCHPTVLLFRGWQISS